MAWSGPSCCPLSAGGPRPGRGGAEHAQCRSLALARGSSPLQPSARPGVRWWAALPRATWYLGGLQVEAETSQGKLGKSWPCWVPKGRGAGVRGSSRQTRAAADLEPSGKVSGIREDPSPARWPVLLGHHRLGLASSPAPPCAPSADRNPLAESGGRIPGSLLAP